MQHPRMLCKSTAPFHDRIAGEACRATWYSFCHCNPAARAGTAAAAVLLQAMSADEFERHKAALASNKLQKDTTLGQEGDRLWEQVGYYKQLVVAQYMSHMHDLACRTLEASNATRVS